MTKPELDPERVARVKAAITRLAAAQDARKSMKPNTPEWTAHRRVLAAACDPAFLLSLIEAAEGKSEAEGESEDEDLMEGNDSDGIPLSAICEVCGKENGLHNGFNECPIGVTGMRFHTTQHFHSSLYPVASASPESDV